MPYATQQNLIDRFGEDELIALTDRADPPAEAVDAAVIAQALADADALIDSYIGRRYALPLAQTPDRLGKLAADIARYFLHKDIPTETVDAAHKEAVAALRDISRGVAELDVGGTEPETSGGTVQVSAPERVFTQDKMSGF